jgi:predicted acyltransferase
MNWKEQRIPMPIQKSGRIPAIDQFRGFAIILMVLVNYLSGIQTIPAYLKHVPDIGMNFPDLGAPVFIFAIGLTYGMSFRRRRAQDGLPAALGHFLRRYLAFIGIGAVITAGQTLLGRELELMDWGVLQAIGAAGLLTLIVIWLPTGPRLFVGLALLALYQTLLDCCWLDLVLGSQHGGLIGSLSWAALLILATVMGDIYQEPGQQRYFPWISLALLAGGFLLAFLVPVSKNRVSATYDLITLGFSGAIFSVFYRAKFNLGFFSAWGRNPLLLYLAAFLVTGLFVLPGGPGWYSEAALWLVGIQALILLFSLSALALYLDRQNWVFSM